MIFPTVYLALTTSVLVTAVSSIDIDTRSISAIYAAAQKEQGVLQVAYGGDGLYP